MGVENQYPIADHTETASRMTDDSKDMPMPVGATAPHAEHGPLVDHKIPQEDAVPLHPELLWPSIRRSMRDYFSEFFGVFILILFGDGVVAQVVLSKGEKGDYQSISWGWGIGVVSSTQFLPQPSLTDLLRC
jgi:aquaglyceroporin related protein, other eukaryote